MSAHENETALDHARVGEILQVLNSFPPARTVAERRVAFARLSRWSGSPAPGVRVENRTFSSRDGQLLSLRLYQSTAGAGDRPLLLYFHGGGYVAGDLDTHHVSLSQVAALTDALIVHLDYRRAPEHRYPVALNDAEDALLFLRGQATLWGADPARVIVAGDSAGGNLAAALCLKCRFLISRQILIYPTLDARFTSSSWRERPEGWVASAQDSREFNLLYARTEADFIDPVFSPVLSEDLAGLPPAHFFVGDQDPARGDSELYVDHLRRAGVQAELEIFPGMIHGFMTMAGALAGSRDLHDEIAAVCESRKGRPNERPLAPN